MQTIIESQIEQKKPIKKYAVISAIIIIALLLSIKAFTSGNTKTYVSGDNLYIGEVASGTLIKDVRAPGNLVAIDKQWLSARVSAKVIKRVLEPGAKVTPDSVILELSSPDLTQSYKQEQIQYKVVQAQLDALAEVQITEMQKQKAAVSLLEVEKQQAIEDAIAKKQLRETKIIPEYQYNEAVLREKKLTLELEIARFELKQLPRLQASLLKVEQAKVEQQALQVSLLQEQVDRLSVKAGMYGVLQSIAVEEGQEVSKGTELARVANQTRLKAELRVQESQARDIQLGQIVEIDTRRSKISGTVMRIDPAVLNGTVTVDVNLPTNLPSEARPDLRVNGVVEIERLENVLLLDKPAQWQEADNAYLFKLVENSQAVKTKVTFGASSTSSIQLLSGLKAGDKVILSQLPEYSEYDTLTIN